MRRFRFKKIDAFVEGRSGGNPAGCVYLPDEDALSAAEMQQIARELAGFVSEVVYIYSDEGYTALRYFSRNVKWHSAGTARLLLCMT